MEKKFKIGLVMAGAVSAGAYTMGVLDFIFEALGEWEKAYNEYKSKPEGPGNPPVPKPNVELAVVTGASAGGMCAAITALRSFQHWEPVRQNPGDYDTTIRQLKYRPAHWSPGDPGMSVPDPNGKTSFNFGYWAWVDKVDILPFLEQHDLAKLPNNQINSLLDCSVLDAIAQACFTPALMQGQKVDRPPYLAKDMQLLLTVSSLLGAPYGVPFQRASPEQQYGTKRHADFVRFCLSDNQPEGLALDDRGAWLLKTSDFTDAGDGDLTAPWSVLHDTALATGAFPVALKARGIGHRVTNELFCRNTFERAKPFDGSKPDQVSLDRHATVKPTWINSDGTELTDYPLVSAYSDGGILNNEPFDLAESLLLPKGRAYIDPAADRVAETLLMVDPFSAGAPGTVNDYGMMHDEERDARRGLDESLMAIDKIVLPLIMALRRNNTFKPRDVADANDPDNYSRFLIAPSRYEFFPQTGVWSNKPVMPSLASGAMEAFSGFLFKEYRVHDYQLGRRNAQNFLRRHFALPATATRPEGNPIFAGHSVLVGSNEFVPIIPLYGTALDENYQMRWPEGLLDDVKWTAIRDKAEARAQVLVKRALDRSDFLSFLPDFLGIENAVENAISRYVANKIDPMVDSLKASLKEYGL